MRTWVTLVAVGGAVAALLVASSQCRRDGHATSSGVAKSVEPGTRRSSNTAAAKPAAGPATAIERGRATASKATRPLATAPELDRSLGPVDAGASLSFAQLWERLDVVAREYDRWFDAGLGPEQVRIRLLPDGQIETRVSVRDLDRPSIAPGVLTAWDLYDRDPRVSAAVTDMHGLANELTDPCLAAFLRRLHAQGRKLTEGLDWTYVWHVRSVGGRGSVVDVEVRDAWWPALFDAQDRACHLAAFEELERRALITDAPDFDYRVETGACITKEEP
jgi:hypothetical protein